MAYTVIAAGEGGQITSALTISDALRLVHDLEKEGEQVVITSDTGWVLTIEELEALAKS